MILALGEGEGISEVGARSRIKLRSKWALPFMLKNRCSEVILTQKSKYTDSINWSASDQAINILRKWQICKNNRKHVRNRPSLVFSAFSNEIRIK